MAQQGDTSIPAVLLLELNEADGHHLRKLIRRGALPALERMQREGAQITTRVPGWDAKASKAWRRISPWIVWPSLYTGLSPEEHGLVGFGQDPSAVVGRCLWDVLDAAGVSTGVFGSLMSHPPRNAGHARFYVPEALANDDDCFPESARPLQTFSLFAARNYSESFGGQALRGAGLLLRTLRSGVRPATLCRVLRQVPDEWIRGAEREPERAMLQAYLGRDAFLALYRRHRPRFATFHTNHVAYMQHRYWRAAEPERFAAGLSETDARHFATHAEREAHERRFAHWIETSLRFADRLVGEFMALLPEGGLLLVATGLGQRPMDPQREIHNPVVRLVREGELFAALGLRDLVVRHQMNPDLTLDLRDEPAAKEAEREISQLRVGEDEPLFAIQRRGAQLFLELEIPSGRGSAPLEIHHRQRRELRVPFERHVVEHGPDQSTAHHKDGGLLWAWRRGGAVVSDRPSMPVTDFAPTVLSLFGLESAAWMHPSGAPALRLAPSLAAADAATA